VAPMVISSMTPFFYGNVDFDDWGNVGHVSFFKRIRGRNGVVELVDMP
jgi:hypothetical protein